MIARLDLALILPDFITRSLQIALYAIDERLVLVMTVAERDLQRVRSKMPRASHPNFED
jgi:hypothetical protein